MESLIFSAPVYVKVRVDDERHGNGKFVLIASSQSALHQWRVHTDSYSLGPWIWHCVLCRAAYQHSEDGDVVWPLSKSYPRSKFRTWGWSLERLYLELVNLRILHFGYRSCHQP